jgi:tetratricopeptide (TPR) repeat protein
VTDPACAPAYRTQAAFDEIIGRDYPAAVQHLERGLALDPANVDIIGIAAAVARRLGRLDLAISLGEYQVAHDPVSVEGYDGLGLAYRYNGQLDESIAAYRKLLSLAPDAGWNRTALGSVLLEKGDAEAALAEFQKEPIEVYRLCPHAQGPALVAAAAKNGARARAVGSDQVRRETAAVAVRRARASRHAAAPQSTPLNPNPRRDSTPPPPSGSSAIRSGSVSLVPIFATVGFRSLEIDVSRRNYTYQIILSN